MAFSFYYYSRLDIHRSDGTPVDCEDLRAGCAALVAADGYRGDYSYASIDTTADAVRGPGAPLKRSNAVRACPARRSIRVRLGGTRRRPVVKVKVYVDRRLVLTRTGRRLRLVSLPGLPGSRPHVLRVLSYTRSGQARRLTRRVWGCEHVARARR